jgi:hypothetical protein
MGNQVVILLERFQQETIVPCKKIPNPPNRKKDIASGVATNGGDANFPNTREYSNKKPSSLARRFQIQKPKKEDSLRRRHKRKYVSIG